MCYYNDSVYLKIQVQHSALLRLKGGHKAMALMQGHKVGKEQGEIRKEKDVEWGEGM
jgi:hypothetical protein